jgi:two-component system phosphate regulon response regulator PhoB
MARVLVIEDEIDVRDVLAYNLRQAGHHVEVSATGEGGLRLAREQFPDVVLLDLMLPDVNGADICRTLKRESATKEIRVVIVSAKGDEIDRVVGFEIGADDYIAKPFSVRELLLRVQAVLRRGTSDSSPSRVARFGELRIDREAHRVWVGANELSLTTLEFSLLLALYDRQNRVQSRSALLQTVWGVHEDVTSRTVDTHVKRLREKLGPAGRYIATVRGVGYRFIESVEEAKEEEN